MKMRQETGDAAESKKKEDIDDNESIESVSDDEFDKYLGKSDLNIEPLLCYLSSTLKKRATQMCRRIVSYLDAAICSCE